MNHFIRIWWQTSVWNKNSLISRNEKSWNSIFLQLLLTFLWSCQKSGPFKMYMALRTFQKNFMSPIFDNNSNWPPKLSTNVIVTSCMFNIQACMIHFCVRSNTLIKMMYHTFLDITCTMNYDHICTQMLPAEFSICYVQASRLPDDLTQNENKNAKFEILFKG